MYQGSIFFYEGKANFRDHLYYDPKMHIFGQNLKIVFCIFLIKACKLNMLWCAEAVFSEVLHADYQGKIFVEKFLKISLLWLFLGPKWAIFKIFGPKLSKFWVYTAISEIL